MKINSLNFQRNGVAGESFYQLSFALDGEKLIAIFQTEPDERTVNKSKCFVIDPLDMSKAYRGDQIAYKINDWFKPCFKGKESSFILYDMIEIINKSNQVTFL